MVFQVVPGGRLVRVRSSMVSVSESSIRRARPRTGLFEEDSEVPDSGGDDGGGVSRIHTAAPSFLAPEPLRIAVRPVSWILVMMVEGGAVPVTVMMLSGMENEREWIVWLSRVARAVDREDVQSSQWRETEKVAV